ncbi:hypothetical protein MYX65_09815 [Acidobacteria bacterium AH-259-L09]|nr:hypothetical protein [Acidobacteria bacterium AH-259-L09]
MMSFQSVFAEQLSAYLDLRRAFGFRFQKQASELLICAENEVGPISAWGIAHEGVDQLEVGTWIFELGSIEFIEQMFNRSIGPRIGHRMNADRQDSPLGVDG